MKLLVIDGNSLLNRAFYGVSMLTNKQGEYTNALFGFINILFKLLAAEQPDGVVAAFDVKAPTFRHKAYGGYKAGRKPMPPELYSQLDLTKEWLRLAGYFVVEKEGYEADDVLGTLSLAAEEQGHTCVLATGDRDSFQLIGPHTKVLLSTTKAGHPEAVTYDEAFLYETYGLTPSQMIELKAVMGDSSDKIPGVPGIGEKGATELIKRFGSVEGIYAHLDDDSIKPGTRAKLEAGKDSAALSRFLGTIDRHVPLDTVLEHYRFVSRDEDGLAALMTRLELFKQLEQMGLAPATAPAVRAEADTGTYTTVDPDGFSPDARTVYYYNNGHLAALCDGTLCVADWQADAARIRTWLCGSQEKEVFDSKQLYRLCAKEGYVPVGLVFDTTLAAYLCDPDASRYEIDRLCDRYGVTAGDPSRGDEQAAVVRVALLDRVLAKELTVKEQMKLLTDIELPLAEVLADMEETGVAVEPESITAMGDELAVRLERLTQEITEAVGYSFNLNSPKQLGEALFETLHLPYGKKTAKGYSTSAEVLEGLKGVHPVIDRILEYRRLSKLKSTYCDALPGFIAADGRIHSTFNQTETRTGRISSLEPNLQNIPVRSEEGKRLRRFFVAREGYTLCDADYSQIELRVLAALSADPAMCKAFKEGRDIHTATASQVFGIAPEEVTPLMRSRAKAVNFGIVYGIGAFSLSKDIGVSRKEADTYIKNYLSVYGGLASYLNGLIEQAKQNGYVSTLFGRRRYLPELSSSNHMVRSFGERVARNAPIQGTAADLIKIAMIRVYRRLKREHPSAKLILQVHDELIVECPVADADTVSALLRQEMEHAVELSVAMQVEVHTGRTWYEAKG